MLVVEHSFDQIKIIVTLNYDKENIQKRYTR